MSEIDPYREWLGVSDPQRPPNHYRLLGLEQLETDKRKIEQSSMVQLALVLRHEGGPNDDLARRLIAELERAGECLLDDDRKRAYDSGLRSRLKHELPGGSPSRQPDAAVSQSLEPADRNPVVSAFKNGAPGHPAPMAVSNKAPDDVVEKGDYLQYLSDENSVPNPEPAAPSNPPAREIDREVTPDPPAEPVHETPVAASLLDDPNDDDDDDDDEQDDKPSPATGRRSAALAAKLAKNAEKQRNKKKGKTAGAKAVRSASRDDGDSPAKAIIAAGVTLVIATLAIAYQLGDWHYTPDPVPTIAVLIADPDPQTRFAAIQSLRNLGAGPDSIPILIKTLQDDQVTAVRLAAADALAQSPTNMSPYLSELNQVLASEKDAEIRDLLKYVVDRLARP